MLERHTASGLLVAEHGADERAVRSQLRQLDPSLRLSLELHPSGRPEYVVVKTFTDDAVILTRWRDPVTGEPLPLSSGIVEKVKRQDPNTRAPQEDEAAHNARLQERVNEEMRQTAEDEARAVQARHGRMPVFHRSRGLYLARSRARARGEEA